MAERSYSSPLRSQYSAEWLRRSNEVLMVGATGKYARLIVRELKKLGVSVRALVRDKSNEGKARERFPLMFDEVQGIAY